MPGSAGALASRGSLRKPLREHDRNSGLWRSRRRWWRRRRTGSSIQSTASIYSLFVGGQRYLDALHHDGAGLARDSLLPPDRRRDKLNVRERDRKKSVNKKEEQHQTQADGHAAVMSVACHRRTRRLASTVQSFKSKLITKVFKTFKLVNLFANFYESLFT